MMETKSARSREKRLNRWITVVSIAVPLVVVLLFGVRLPGVEPLGFLPPIYAGINGLTAVLLLTAVWAIKNGRRELHQKLMTTCIVLSSLFLLMYVAYHMTSDSTTYGGEGWLRYVYFFILISHIMLSVAVIPLVLRTYAKAYLKDFESHRKIARVTFPIWLYVAITGVVVYLMISPYYPY
jgi:putative membrane protein